jgi:hypothetical protein
MKKNEKLTIAFFIGWIFIHVTIYITVRNIPDSGALPYYRFWPIDRGSIFSAYDLSELLIYSITPIIIYIVFKILNRVS